jgi:hypothetical protein
MKRHLIMAAILMMAIRAGGQGLSFQYATSNELADTVLSNGQFCVVEGNYADLRVGDGVTPGGVRVGDGVGLTAWTLSTDLSCAGHDIILGDGYSIHMIGPAWGMLSGEGDVTMTNGAMVWSVFGTEILSVRMPSALVHVQNFSYSTNTFSAEFVMGPPPVIQYSASVRSPSWSDVTVDVGTNGSSLHLTWPFPAGVTGGYYRAKAGVNADASFAILGVSQPHFLGIFTNRNTTTVIPTQTGDYYWDTGSNYMIECAGAPSTTNNWRQR